VGRFADGVAVRQVGEQTFRIAQQVVDACVTVSNDEICGAMKEIFEDRRAIVEPAGALAYAGLRRYVEEVGWKRRSLVAITCGANVNFDSLRHVSERAEIGERREAILAVTIPERPGTFRRFCATIGARAITEFNYRYSDSSEAHVFVGMRVSDQQDTMVVIQALEREGFPVLDLTDDEMAKLHLRHMVGGRAGGAEHEVLFRFEFPERAGALIQFLEALGGEFNISLFHYRNHGSDVGRVLAGFQVAPNRREAFLARLQNCGYPFEEESENPAYRMFLR
jgi:threonine dehydratase